MDRQSPIQFHFSNIPLQDALDTLINGYYLPILYQDQHVEGINLSGDCAPCNSYEALTLLLKDTDLIWQKAGRQFIILKSEIPKPKRTGLSISGFVRDHETGEPVYYANVSLKDTYWGSATNQDGYFMLVDAPVGVCTLQVSYIGYTTNEIVFDNVIGKSALLQIDMHQNVIELEGVTVVPDGMKILRNADEVGQITFSPRHIQSLPNIGETDIFRSLQLLPGISGGDDGSSGLYIRGGTPDQNLVILDGMTVYHVDHFFGLFSAFNADAIKDVQVYKGGFPAKYGGRLSSVVELTGKTGNINKFHTGFGANLLSSHTLIETPLFGKGSWLLSIRRSYTDFLKSPLYNKLFDFVNDENVPAGENIESNPPAGSNDPVFGNFRPDFYFYDINSKLKYTPTNKDVFTVSFYNGKDYLDRSLDFSGLEGVSFSSAEGDSAGTAFKNDDITDWGNLGASVKWSRRWYNRFYSNLLFAHSTYFSEQFANMGGFTFNEDNYVKDLTFRIDNEWYLTESHRMEFGIWISQLNTNYTMNFDDTLSIVDEKISSLQNSYYLQDKWKAGKTLELTFGLRGTYYDRTKSNYFAPRTSFRYFISDKLTLKGAWGHYYQFINQISNDDVLTGSRNFWLLADKNLIPGFAEHTILGLHYENRAFLFSIEAYTKNMENLIEFSPRFITVDEDNPFIIGTGTAKGLEFLAQKKVGFLSGWISYTLARVEHQFSELNDGKPFSASYDKTHDLKIVNMLSKGPWNCSLTWLFSSGRAYTSPENQYSLTLIDGYIQNYIHISKKNAYRFPPFHRMDLNISRRFKSDLFNWDVGLSIFNVYNQKNIWYRSYNLNTTPIVVSDVLRLGFTPTIYFKAEF